MDLRHAERIKHACLGRVLSVRCMGHGVEVSWRGGDTPSTLNAPRQACFICLVAGMDFRPAVDGHVLSVWQA